MLKRVKESKTMQFIIGTEEGIIYRLKKENPNKEFYSLGDKKICSDMKKITLESVKTALKEEIYLIELGKKIIEDAKVPLEKMLEYS